MDRKLERFDAGFSAYCGFIHLEVVHRNSLMLAVASYLYTQILNNTDENKRKYSFRDDQHQHRPSLVFEADLRNLWQES